MSNTLFQAISIRNRHLEQPEDFALSRGGVKNLLHPTVGGLARADSYCKSETADKAWSRQIGQQNQSSTAVPCNMDYFVASGFVERLLPKIVNLVFVLTLSRVVTSPQQRKSAL